MAKPTSVTVDDDREEELARLGLDIARRIVVERHSGQIAIVPRGPDQPPGALVTVRLPVRGRT